MGERQDSYGRFHLKDGRRLVFYPIRQTRIARRLGEAVALAFVLVAAVLAATLLAAGHAPRHNRPELRRAAVR